jgi:hypothetical protein
MMRKNENEKECPLDDEGVCLRTQILSSKSKTRCVATGFRFVSSFFVIDFAEHLRYICGEQCGTNFC